MKNVRDIFLGFYFFPFFDDAALYASTSMSVRDVCKHKCAYIYIKRGCAPYNSIKKRNIL